MPTKQGGRALKNASTSDRCSFRRNTALPAASTPCSWKTRLAMSKPTVVISMVDGSFSSLHSTARAWHIDAVRGRPPHQILSASVSLEFPVQQKREAHRSLRAYDVVLSATASDSGSGSPRSRRSGAMVRSGRVREVGRHRVAQHIAAPPYGLDVVFAASRLRDVLSQLRDEHVDNLQLGLTHAAVEVVEEHLLRNDRTLAQAQQFENGVLLAADRHRPAVGGDDAGIEIDEKLAGPDRRFRVHKNLRLRPVSVTGKCVAVALAVLEAYGAVQGQRSRDD